MRPLCGPIKTSRTFKIANGQRDTDLGTEREKYKLNPIYNVRDSHKAETETQAEREGGGRDRQTYRQTDRRTDSQTDSQTDRRLQAEIEV